MKEEKLELLAPFAFLGLKFKLGENLLTIREINGSVGKASDGEVEILMERRGNQWYKRETSSPPMTSPAESESEDKIK
jgi:hypothetical protein